MIEVDPFVEEAAVAVEDLHAVVLAIGDQDLAEAVDPDGVRGGELARSAAGLAPRGDPASVGGEAVHVGIAVAVGDVDLAVGGLRRGGWMVERRVGRGPMALA